MNQQNPTYLESILLAIDAFHNSNDVGGVPKEAIFKYCALNRSFTNRLQMLNQIRLTLRRAVDDGLLTVDESGNYARRL